MLFRSNNPQVIYEIWNEPTEHPWSEIKEYAEEIIPIIRKNSPDAVVIVATPRWDQDVDIAADNPITELDNIMYAVHFYADTHKEFYQDKMMYAINKGMPVFLSECAAMDHTGDGNINIESWNKWMQLAKENNISVIMWSISDKVETCSMLVPDSPSKGMEWKEEHMKPWAKIVKEHLKGNK